MAGDTGDHEGLAALAALLERVAEAVLNEQVAEIRARLFLRLPWA